MQTSHPSWTIGRLAKSAGVGVETIRFYQRKGLLRTPVRPPGGVRRYGQDALERLHFIKAAQRLGFSLEEIGRLLQLDQGMQCRAAAELAAHHLREVRSRLRDLERMEATFADLLERCRHGAQAVTCPLIAALQAESAVAPE